MAWITQQQWKRETSKGQIVRLIDVFVLGPATILAALWPGALPTWFRVALLGYGAATIVYNARNYFATRRDEATTPPAPAPSYGYSHAYAPAYHY